MPRIDAWHVLALVYLHTLLFALHARPDPKLHGCMTNPDASTDNCTDRYIQLYCYYVALMRPARH